VCFKNRFGGKYFSIFLAAQIEPWQQMFYTDDLGSSAAT
jgi:hypothetical protein